MLQHESLRTAKLISEPGTLAFFRGRYSLHRVPPVEGSTPRMNSVLTYSVEPGHRAERDGAAAVLRPNGLARRTFSAARALRG